MKKWIVNSFMFIFFMLVFLSFGDKVDATYYEICNMGEVETNSFSYNRCGTKIVYLYEEDKKHSSYIISNNTYGSSDELLYAGKIDGLDTFYGYKFLLYRVVYDDRGFFTHNDDMWMDMSINGLVVYSGEFKDSGLIDNSSAGFNVIYNEVGTYLLRQYKGGKVVKSIRVIIVGREDYDLNIKSAMWGGDNLASGQVTFSEEDMSFEFSGGKYGFANKVGVEINSCNLKFDFGKKISIPHEIFSKCVLDNDVNVVTLNMANGLNMSKSFTYKFKVSSENVSIKLESSISKIATSSRRIVIRASAGEGDTLDESSSLYYWSRRPDDRLTYQDFMSNYAVSEHRGSYTSDKGVILRNEVGTYYLYALAKDSDSVAVVRSDEYILTENNKINKVNQDDVIFVIILSILAILPIIVYIVIRGKDTL